MAQNLAQATDTIPTKTTTRTSLRKCLPYILMALFALFVLTCCRMIVTAGPSMKPTYTQGDVLLCVRSWAAPKKGTPVLIEKDGILMVKRIGYVAGDDVAGQEWFTDRSADTSCSDTPLYWGDTVIPEGYVFVTGDNPLHSYDSRYADFGLVPIEDIWGIVLLEF